LKSSKQFCTEGQYTSAGNIQELITLWPKFFVRIDRVIAPFHTITKGFFEGTAIC